MNQTTIQSQAGLLDLPTIFDLCVANGILIHKVKSFVLEVDSIDPNNLFCGLYYPCKVLAWIEANK